MHLVFIKTSFLLSNECISFLSYSILSNCSLFGNFILSRRFRQGDPLSSDLFILYAKVLSCMLVKAKMDGNIFGVKVAKGTPSVSYSLRRGSSFIFFCNNNLNEVRETKDILDDYCDILGQLINFNKLAICFSEGSCKNKCDS